MTTPNTIYLKDYKKPDYFIDSIDLFFNIFDDKTLVSATSHVLKNPELKTTGKCFLHGEKMKLLSVKVNGENWKDYKLSSESLELLNVPDNFRLEICNEILPQENTALEGLYQSGEMFCTQNEPEGFRKITYYVDRPDNMAKFKTTIEANKQRFPILLSNGNDVERKDLGERHSVTWVDPFKKPSYLFALVAGDFDILKDTYKTKSGRIVRLEIYVDKGDLDKTDHAMDSLKKSMKWDEERFGLEYDLDIYMIVSASSFNMGAMENKGLNIFNSRLVLANPKTATDADFEAIESVIGHEYFHNWTGNRVTCRDWFQLTLKEGLTVFRDQEFTSDVSSRGVKRIEDVNQLRLRQFPEDASPTSHPIKPNSYIEINNFYTPTVYEKGAEVIRMIHTLIGEKNFRAGMDLYFKSFDGQAVRTEDFVWAMETASGKDLGQFKNWYDQYGTPSLKVREIYQQENYSITLTQIDPSKKGPLVMPIKVSLFDQSGKVILGEKLLEFNEIEKTFELGRFQTKPILSINRNFSTPVKIDFKQPLTEIAVLFSHDNDYFNRFEAGNIIKTKVIFDYVENKSLENFNLLSFGFEKILDDQTIDFKYKAFLLSFPHEIELNGAIATPQFYEVFIAKNLICEKLANVHHLKIKNLYHSFQDETFSLDEKSIGKRALKNRCLSFLSYIDAERPLILNQYKSAKNMTDTMASFSNVCNLSDDRSIEVINDFYNKFKTNELVIDKWFAGQCSTRNSNTLEIVKVLLKHPAYTIKNPNRLRSVLFSFTNNLRFFHDESGIGYELLTDKIIEVDAINPQMGSFLSKAGFKSYKQLNENLKLKMKVSLERILNNKSISKDTFEIVSKIYN